MSDAETATARQPASGRPAAEREMAGLQRRVLVRGIRRAGFDDLAQRPVQRFHAVGGVNRSADVRRIMEKRRRAAPRSGQRVLIRQFVEAVQVRESESAPEEATSAFSSGGDDSGVPFLGCMGLGTMPVE